MTDMQLNGIRHGMSQQAIYDAHFTDANGLCRCDTGDAAASRRVAAWMSNHLPAVQTYAHAAGALGYDSIADMEPEAFWDVCRPKIVGAAFAERFSGITSQAMFSSTAAVWSQPGAAHYSAANTYLDAEAAALR